MSAKAAVQDALHGLLRDDEIVVHWIATIEVAGPNGVRYLAHRAGGGHDGQEPPMAWAALGMSRAAMQAAERQLASATHALDGGEPDEGES